MGIGDIGGTKRLLLQLLDCAFDKRSWHGANLMSAIRGVRAPAAAKTIAGRKSIWQQILHAAYWKHAALNKLVGTTPFPRRGSNWPKLPERLSEKAWRADIDLLRDQHATFRRAIVKLPPEKLTPRLIWLIHGVAAHDVYHAGQIKLLRRLI
jgi:hypothetical protein